jgi:MFS transporter, OCT family, solute carrier family 22 (organic cation transporter), member 4/5
MDLMCTPAATVGLLISAYYIGYIIGGAFFHFPDRYGRKFSLALSFAIAIFSQTVMLTSKNFTVRLICFGLLGLSQIKNVVSYVWFSECVPLTHKPLTYAIINIVDALPLVLMALYFMFISRSWLYINVVATALCYLAFIIIPFCPESPRWLLVNGRRKEAILALN